MGTMLPSPFLSLIKSRDRKPFVLSALNIRAAAYPSVSTMFSPDIEQCISISHLSSIPSLLGLEDGEAMATARKRKYSDFDDPQEALPPQEPRSIQFNDYHEEPLCSRCAAINLDVSQIPASKITTAR